MVDGAGMKTELTEPTKNIIDALSVVTVIGTLAQVLPSIAALFTIIWTGLRIWETETVRNLTGRGKAKEPKSAD
jgi:hypothetical protein